MTSTDFLLSVISADKVWLVSPLSKPSSQCKLHVNPYGMSTTVSSLQMSGLKTSYSHVYLFPECRGGLLVLAMFMIRRDVDLPLIVSLLKAHAINLYPTGLLSDKVGLKLHMGIAFSEEITMEKTVLKTVLSNPLRCHVSPVKRKRKILE